MPDVPSQKTAADWLDSACRYENDGKAKAADLAFGRACKLDAAEHEDDTATASLPRRTA